MTKARDDMRLVVGLDVNGAALPLRVDSAGRLEIVNERTVHAARAYHNAHQSVSNAAWNAIALNSEEFDTDGMHDLVTNNSRLTIIHSGLYMVGGAIQYVVNTTGIRSAAVRKNGSTLLTYQHTAAFATYGVMVSCASLVSLVAGDYIELTGYQSSGGSLTAEATPGAPVLWAARL